MKKYFAAVLLCCCLSPTLWKCTDKFDDNVVTDTTEPALRTEASADDAVYHEETRSWIRYRKDPYALSNFQKARDNLLSAKFMPGVLRDSLAGLAETQLEATHYDIRIFPKNEAQLHELEAMKDVVLSYIPFDHVQLPAAETEKLQKPTWPDARLSERRYRIVRSDAETEDGPPRTVTHLMPTVYAVWPCGKELPADMDYEVLYEVFLPEKFAGTKRTELSSGALEILEKEALELAAESSNGTDKQKTIVPEGHCYHYDNFLEKKVPLVGLKIRFRYGSAVWETFTDAQGRYHISQNIPAAATLSMVFEGEDWRITYDGQVSPIIMAWGANYQWHRKELCPVSSLPMFETHRAVQFFKAGNHPLAGGNAINIGVTGPSQTDVLGLFHYSSTSDPWILIYYNNKDAPNRLLCTIFHELGHNSMYSYKGYNNYSKNTDKVIRESWGRFTGWYMTERYYASLGYGIVKPTGPEESLGNDGQLWHGLYAGGDYSPVMIDLRDDFNQRDYHVANKDGYYSYYHGYPDDDIKDVPANIIQSIAFRSGGRDSYAELAQRYVGIYYTQDAFERYFYNAFSLYW